MMARAMIRIKMYLISPADYIISVTLMSVDLLAFVFTYRYLGMPREFSTFVMIGGILNAYWIHSLWNVGVSTYWEKNRGILQRYLTSPASLLSVFMGSALGTSIGASGVAVIVLIFSFILRFPMHIVDPALAILIFAFTVLNIMFIGAMFSSLFLLWGREGWLWGLLFEEPIYIASGVYYPLKFMPKLVHFFSYFVPLSFGIDALRQVVVGESMGWLPLKYEVFALISMTFVFFFLSSFFAKKICEVARREGKLVGVEE